MGWQYESVGSKLVKRLGSWMREQHDELEEDIQTALDYATTLKGEEMKKFLTKMKKRISVRREYIDSNFGAVGGLHITSDIQMRPKPDLITGREKPQ